MCGGNKIQQSTIKHGLGARLVVEEAGGYPSQGLATIDYEPVVDDILPRGRLICLLFLL